MEKYIAIIGVSDHDTEISEAFATIEEAVSYGVLKNYGKGFRVAKWVDYQIIEK